MSDPLTDMKIKPSPEELETTARVLNDLLEAVKLDGQKLGEGKEYLHRTFLEAAMLVEALQVIQKENQRVRPNRNVRSKN